MIEILICASAVSWCQPSPDQAEPAEKAILYSSPCESHHMMLSEYFWFSGKLGRRDICWRLHNGIPVIESSGDAKAIPTPKPMQCKVTVCTPIKDKL